MLSVGTSTSTAAEPVAAKDLAYKWSGPASNARLGEELHNAGDMNGDGIDDFVAPLDGATYRGAWVLYGPLDTSHQADITNLSPSDGYRMVTAADVLRVSVVGDQNDDGIKDFMVQVGSDTTLVYGVADPANDLADCAPGSQTKCVSVANPEADDGARLGFKLTYSSSIAGGNWTGADVNGDGADEILIPSIGTNQILVAANGLGDGCDPTPGLCTVSLASLSAPELVAIDPPYSGGIVFAGRIVSPGDVNGDGRDDILTSSGTDGSVAPAIWVIYGQDWDSSPVSTAGMGASEGYGADLPYSSFQQNVFGPGDVNGDGIMDIGVQSISLVPSPSSFYTVLYGQSGTPDVDASVDPPAPGTGIQYQWDAATVGLSTAGIIVGLGDLNNDGGDEFAIGDSAANVGAANMGAVNVVQSQGADAPNVIPVNGTTADSTVMRLTGTAGAQRFGSAVAPAGDVDGDGLNDIAAGAYGISSNAGQLSLVRGSAYYGSATTGLAASVTTTSATLGGTADPNGRESSAYFEYGTTTGYGSRTNDQGVGKGKASKFVEADVSGLTANTEYHYRAVIENDLGIRSYGPDRRFTTAQEVTPPSQCETDPTAPGCPDFCKGNPTAAGCDDKAGLSALVASSSAKKVKRGKKVTVSTWITSVGTKSAAGVKICLKAPKKFIKGAKCQNVGNLASGKTALKRFKVTVKKKAKKGKKVTLSLSASGNGLGNKTAKVKITVK